MPLPSHLLLTSTFDSSICEQLLTCERLQMPFIWPAIVVPICCRRRQFCSWRLSEILFTISIWATAVIDGCSMKKSFSKLLHLFVMLMLYQVSPPIPTYVYPVGSSGFHCQEVFMNQYRGRLGYRIPGCQPITVSCLHMAGTSPGFSLGRSSKLLT